MLIDQLSYNERVRRRKHILLFVTALIVCIVAVVLIVSREDEVPSPEAQHPIQSLGMPEWNDSFSLERPVFSEENEVEHNNSSTEIEDPFHIQGKVRKNQTVFVALKNHDLDPKDIHALISSMSGVYDFKRSRPGDTYEVFLNADRRIIKFKYVVSAEEIYVSELDGNLYLSRKQSIDKVVRTQKFSGTLTSSLYDAFVALGESGDLAAHFMHLFVYDIDFGSDSQEGDTFEVLVDKVYLDGNFYKYGRLWYANYKSVSTGNELNAYYFIQPGEKTGEYYNAEGQSLRKSFLKTPIVGCKMTSPYDLKRMHPIHKRIRPHHGVDWACPTGTPIMSVADGVVQFAEWKGANGNLLVIDHGNGFTSLSAHLYGFPRGIKKGVHVKQGQVVGYVGTTGVSTGPHLHFGMKKNGEYFDPMTLERTRMNTLTGQKYEAFKQKIQEYKNFIDNSSDNEPTSLDSSSDVELGGPGEEISTLFPVEEWPAMGTAPSPISL